MLQDLTKVKQYQGKGINDFTEKEPTSNYQLDTKLIDSDNFGNFTVTSGKTKIAFEWNTFNIAFITELYKALKESKMFILGIFAPEDFDDQEVTDLKETIGLDNLDITKTSDYRASLVQHQIDVFYSSNELFVSELNKTGQTTGILLNYQKGE